MPEICVVITCYNYGRFVDDAIESVLAQTLPDFEIVVVDDGSEDGDTVERISTLTYPKTRVLRLEHGGAGAARNAGIRASVAPLVCCLDADDQLEPNYLEATSQLLRKDRESKLGFVTTWRRSFGNSTEGWHTSPYAPIEMALANNVHCASLFRRRAWDEVGGYNEAFGSGEDWNFWLNIVARGYRWAVVPEELLRYRVHGPSRNQRTRLQLESVFRQVMKDNEEFYRDHHKTLIQRLFSERVALNKVWLEKSEALRTAAELADQLRQEMASHQAALSAYRNLEDYCNHLRAELEAKDQFISEMTTARRNQGVTTPRRELPKGAHRTPGSAAEAETEP